MVKSKFGANIWFLVLFNLLAFFGMIYVLLFSDFLNIKNSKIPPLLGILIFFCILLYAMSLIIKKVYLIKIDDGKISFWGFQRRIKISHEDIASINMFAKGNYYLLIGLDTVNTEITLTTGKKIIIADPFYRNIGEIKCALLDSYKEKIIPYKSDNNRIPTNLAYTGDLKFAGNAYTSFNSIIFYCMTIFLLSLNGNAGYEITVPILFIMYLLLGSQQNYFIVSENNFIVKNHFWIWYKRSYELENIIAVSFESPYRRSQGLRIIKNDFTSRLYSAGSLRERNWNELRILFKKMGIQLIS